MRRMRVLQLIAGIKSGLCIAVNIADPLRAIRINSRVPTQTRRGMISQRNIRASVAPFQRFNAGRIAWRAIFNSHRPGSRRREREREREREKGRLRSWVKRKSAPLVSAEVM